MRVAVVTKHQQELVEIQTFIRDLEYALILHNLDQHPIFSKKLKTMETNISKIENGKVSPLIIILIFSFLQALFESRRVSERVNNSFFYSQLMCALSF